MRRRVWFPLLLLVLALVVPQPATAGDRASSPPERSAPRPAMIWEAVMEVSSSSLLQKSLAGAESTPPSPQEADTSDGDGDPDGVGSAADSDLGAEMDPFGNAADGDLGAEMDPLG